MVIVRNPKARGGYNSSFHCLPAEYLWSAILIVCLHRESPPSKQAVLDLSTCDSVMRTNN